MLQVGRTFIEKQATEVAWRFGEWLHHHSPTEPRDWRPAFEISPSPSTSPRNPIESPVESLRFRPLETVENPVLTATAVTDFGTPHFVADPFLVADADGTLHVFFEVFDRNHRPTAAIGHATSPDGGLTWTYDRIVLEEDVHLSFPYVFSDDGSYYMVPDKWDDDSPGTLDLYRADSFPGRWRKVTTLVEPERPLHDCVIVYWRERWWAIAGDGRDLSVFSSPELERSNWQAHPMNPVVTDRPRAARPGGRPIVGPDSILLFLQDCVPEYGSRVRSFRIETLTESDYADVEMATSPVLEPSDETFGWNSGRMHHIDPISLGTDWLCAVDGNVNFRRGPFGKYHWSIGLYTAESITTGEMT